MDTLDTLLLSLLIYSVCDVNEHHQDCHKDNYGNWLILIINESNWNLTDERDNGGMRAPLYNVCLRVHVAFIAVKLLFIIFLNIRKIGDNRYTGMSWTGNWFLFPRNTHVHTHMVHNTHYTLHITLHMHFVNRQWNLLAHHRMCPSSLGVFNQSHSTHNNFVFVHSLTLAICAHWIVCIYHLYSLFLRATLLCLSLVAYIEDH